MVDPLSALLTTMAVFSARVLIANLSCLVFIVLL